ncbi:MAG: hypothetical protein JSR72_08195 [Proteobacteria bacterium]|nr:hypothetical protein [Pseudomonadota bacterium]
MAKSARKRAKPGSRAGGAFFHIEVRPARDFVQFRMQDVGATGGVERLAGQRANGSWDTQKWLIAKAHAHFEGGTLVADSREAAKVLKSLGSPPLHVGGDRFKARPRRDIPEAEKPTPAMRRAQLTNIKKAQAASRRKAVKKKAPVAKAAMRPKKSSAR